MDIIDIILASKKSFTGETESLIRQAKEAMAQANEVSSILQEAQETNAAASAANAAAAEAQARAEVIAEDFESLKTDFTSAAEELTNEIIDEKIQAALNPVTENIEVLEDIVTNNYAELDSAIKNVRTSAENAVNITIQDNNSSSAKIKQMTIIKNNNSTQYNVEKNYTSTGTNEDGSMTQKAITAALNQLNQKIENNINYGIVNLGSENSGKIVIVDSNGDIISSSITEEDLIQLLIQSDGYINRNVIGLEIDYKNKNFTRIQEAEGKNQGADFDNYLMYGGRMRCNVNDNGQITAWYGEYNFSEDGSNGQVMVYQPKFYYMRMVMSTTETNNNSKIINKERILLSTTKLPGFKLHPLFKTIEGEELDYVLISAYEGSAYKVNINQYDNNDSSNIDFSTDKLSSIAGVKPISGANKNFTIINAEQMAQNRGSNWHITNLAAESALQMLEAVEFGSLNGQNSLELGIVNIPNNSKYNCASLTGSTNSLGNTTGAANETVNEINGVYNTYSEIGRRAISYRGMENPWGNIWRMIGGLNIVGDGASKGGMPYICTDFNYSLETPAQNYRPLNLYLLNNYNWISAFGYATEEYDWTFIPVESSGGNSALPIGDGIWTQANLNATNIATIGGVWSYSDSCGPFYYAFDILSDSAAKAYSARLMYIPEKNNIYENNINKWKAKMGV